MKNGKSGHLMNASDVIIWLLFSLALAYGLVGIIYVIEEIKEEDK